MSSTGSPKFYLRTVSSTSGVINAVYNHEGDAVMLLYHTYNRPTVSVRNPDTGAELISKVISTFSTSTFKVIHRAQVIGASDLYIPMMIQYDTTADPGLSFLY